MATAQVQRLRQWQEARLRDLRPQSSKAAQISTPMTSQTSIVSMESLPRSKLAQRVPKVVRAKAVQAAVGLAIVIVVVAVAAAPEAEVAVLAAVREVTVVAIRAAAVVDAADDKRK
jgi:hypothetical protein